jgi:hypothetical protein
MKNVRLLMMTAGAQQDVLQNNDIAGTIAIKVNLDA